VTTEPLSKEEVADYIAAIMECDDAHERLTVAFLRMSDLIDNLTLAFDALADSVDAAIRGVCK
jgi:hypothetical protein